MDISNLRTTVDPGVPTVSGAAPVGGVGSSASGANAPASGSAGAAAAPASGSGTAQAQAQGGASSQAAAHVSAESLHKAVQKINQQLEQSSGVTLSAGLDTSGEHPGQVLVELSDKSTRQTFFKYYVPAQQVVQASQNPGGGSAGALINAKA